MSNYQVIARKWRPQTFQDLVGQEHVTETLKNAILKDRVAHAYIFSGARGVGKTTAARILAKALNCVNGPTADPCGVCAACTEIASGNSLDVIEIDAASNRGIDQIRELREMVRYAPAASRHKVVILDEAHMLTTEASNALLKTLEEPPDRVIFVMATTEPENLEDTIRSRSQHFHFRALTFAEIAGRLEHIAKEENLKIEPGALAVIARMAEGSLRDALSLLEQARAYCGDTIPDKEVRDLLGVVPEDALEELVNAIAEGSADRALGLVHRFQKDGRNLQHFCREAIRHVRNLLIARVCGADSELIAATADQRPALARAAALFGEEDLTRFFQVLLQTDDSLRRAPDPRVHLEMGLLRLVNAGRLALLEEVLSEVKGGSGGGGMPSSSVGRGATGNVAPTTKKMFAESGSGPAGGDSGASAAAEDASTQRTAMATNSVRLGEDSQPFAVAVPFAVKYLEGAGQATRAESSDEGVETVAANLQDVAAVTDDVGEPGVEPAAEGILPQQVAAIKAAIQSEKKFLGELVEHSSRWQLEGSELRIFFPLERKAFAELLEGREALEKIRAAAAKALGRGVRVSTRIESLTAAAAAGAMVGSRGAGHQGFSSPIASGGADANASRTSVRESAELRARFENDPMVRAIIDRFGGKISEVRPPQPEA
jgi:DNA polymerase-3 subunit gamma/tau